MGVVILVQICFAGIFGFIGGEFVSNIRLIGSVGVVDFVSKVISVTTVHCFYFSDITFIFKVSGGGGGARNGDGIAGGVILCGVAAVAIGAPPIHSPWYSVSPRYWSQGSSEPGDTWPCGPGRSRPMTCVCTTEYKN